MKKGLIDELRPMAIFAQTIRKGSFREASKSLGLSPSVVSYHVSQLEARLGTALIYRSTRKLSLTHEGRLLYEQALQMLNLADEAVKQLTVSDGVASGHLTVGLPTAFARSTFNQQIAAFALLNPGISLTLRYTDHRADLISEGIDLAIRAGDMPDSSIKSRSLGEMARKLVCAPTLASQFTTTKPATHPSDINAWPWIRLSMLATVRRFIKQGKQVELNYKANIEVDSVEAMTNLCLHGMGLATPPSFMVDDLIQQGELVEILPDWQVEPIPLYAVWPANVTRLSNTKRLLKHLSAL